MKDEIPEELGYINPTKKIKQINNYKYESKCGQGNVLSLYAEED